MTTPAHNQIPQHQHDLYATALALRAGGCSLVPINGHTKLPYNNLLPRYNHWPRDLRDDTEAGKPTWKPYQTVQPSEHEIAIWIRRGAQIAIATGYDGLTIIDFDDTNLYHDYTATVGPALNCLPLQRTGGDGYQIAFKSERPEPNLKLAHIPDATRYDGRAIGIETRGIGGYAIVYPSLHPSGNTYQPMRGDFARIPVISQMVADHLLQVARSLCKAPYTKQQLDAMQHASQPRTQQLYNGTSVIAAFNAAYNLEQILFGAGYQHCHGQRWSPPGAPRQRDSVIADRSRCFHFDSDYPLSDGKPKDAFDIWCFYEHNGDVRAAVRHAAALLCMERAA